MKLWLQTATLVLAVLVLALVLGAQQNPPPAPAPAPQAPTQKVPPEAAQKPNPVRPTAESLAKGKKTYVIDCALCHGENGDGKNDMDMKNVPDLTNPEVQKSATDGQWFYVIRHGIGDMPGEGTDRAKDEEVWNIVNYVRSFGKK